MKDKDIARFWTKVVRGSASECWQWTAGQFKSGYGQFGTRSPHRMLRAHRVSWTIRNGPIPKGKIVCHRCDNPLCVNPDHLFLGTDLDNVRDKIAKGRFPCIGEGNHTAKLTTQQVLEIRGSPKVPIKTLAKRYGVSAYSVESVRYRKSWKHLP